MRTGKQHINYIAYAVIWANKILVGVRGYSLDKARQISPMFASMVERQIKSYEEQINKMRRISVMFYVFDECKNEIDNIYNITRNDINFLLNNNRKQTAEVAFELHYVGDDIPKELNEALKFNKLWDDRFKEVMTKIGSISLSKLSILPKRYQSIFKQQKQIMTDLVNNISTYNQMILDVEYTIEEYNLNDMPIDEINEYVKEDIKNYAKVQNENIENYHKNMQTIELLRKEILND